MDIVVLAGGVSTERNVSLKTGYMVGKALRENGHRVIILDVFMGYKDYEEDLGDVFLNADAIGLKDTEISATAPDLDAVRASRKDQSNSFFGPNVLQICRKADIVFMALHGENGENGKVQATFDLFGIKYTGSDYLSSAIAMNKQMAKQFMDTVGVPNPKGVLMLKAERCDDVNKLGISLPVVVKPCAGGSSIGVTIAHSCEEFTASLDEAFRWEDSVIIEEYIKGREFSVGVIEGKALPIIEIAPLVGFYDYKNKYKAGSAVETCPAVISDEDTKKMQEYAVKVADVIGLTTYSRIDFLIREDGNMYCLEANTLPGMTPTSLLPQEANVIGMNFNKLCDYLIEISLKKYA